MSIAPQRTFLIRIVPPSRVEAIHEFYKAFLTEHLWPRTLEELLDLAEKGSLYEAIETTGCPEKLVGICYIKQDKEIRAPCAERSEYGGAFVVDECRGLGLATTLGRVAISNHYAWDPPKGRLVGHVHEANVLPRNMLQQQLGFVRNTGEDEIPPAAIALKNMKRNERGEVVGHLFEFQCEKLLEYAKWLEGFSGTIEGKSGESRLRIDLPALTTYKEDALVALREAAAKGKI